MPKRRIGIVPSDVCAATVIATDESIRVSSSIAIAYETVSPPAPPYSSGIGSPMRPSSPSSATSSYGKRASRSSSAATGATRSRANVAHRVADQLLLRSEVEVHAARMRIRAVGSGRSQPTKERAEMADSVQEFFDGLADRVPTRIGSRA